MIDITTKVGQAKLANRTAPIKGLPGPDQSDMEYFIEQVCLMMPVLGYTFLTPRLEKIGNRGCDEPTLFSLEIGQVKATMKVSGNEFIVLKGSGACGDLKPSLNPGYRELRSQLIAEGVLQKKQDAGGNFEFAKDAIFESPTRAAVMVYGGSISGPKQWRLNGSGQSYGEWREVQERKAIPDAPESTDSASSAPDPTVD